MLCHKKKCIRWHLYDIKDALAGENTVVKLYDQWNAGLQYLYNNILKTTPEYKMMSDLGVVTRCYDKERTSQKSIQGTLRGGRKLFTENDTGTAEKANQYFKVPGNTYGCRGNFGREVSGGKRK